MSPSPDGGHAARMAASVKYADFSERTVKRIKAIYTPYKIILTASKKTSGSDLDRVGGGWYNVFIF